MENQRNNSSSTSSSSYEPIYIELTPVHYILESHDDISSVASSGYQFTDYRCLSMDISTPSLCRLSPDSEPDSDLSFYESDEDQRSPTPPQLIIDEQEENEDDYESYDPWWKIQTPTPMEEEVDDIQSSEEELEIFEIKCETQPEINSLNDLNLPAPRPPTPKQFIDTPLSPDPMYTYTFFNDII